MKRFLIFLALICAATTLFAQVALPEHQFASGRWGFVGTRLYQNDVHSGLAKFNLRVPQRGAMIYEFTARYEDGMQDGHGGFGIHVFMDTAYNGRSWGAGNSYLLWLNYDKNATGRVHKGFSAQVYRSRSNSVMDLVTSYDLNQYVPYITWADVMQPVNIRIYVNGDTGEVRVYDPSDPTFSYYWFFFLDRRDLPLRGDWIALRTNGVSLSFGMGVNR